MIKILFRSLLVITLFASMFATTTAREGDTLEPVSLEAPMLVTWPENLLDADTDFGIIEQRVQEARVTGVPLAVRMVDLTADSSSLPFQVRKFADQDFSQPLTAEQQQDAVDAWIRNEPIESEEGANDGFLLLVLIPEDRTQTQAIWWIGPNALPINGLTEENINATQHVMKEEFALGNVPTGTYRGLSEFSYNVQFGVPERIERSTLENALHAATIPMAILSILAGLAIPALAFWLSKKNDLATPIEHELTSWQAAALQLGRARAEIPAAMLLDAFHEGDLDMTTHGGLQLSSQKSNAAVEALRSFADTNGEIDRNTMYEIEAIQVAVRHQIEDELAAIGAMTSNVGRDRTWMLSAMGLGIFLVALSAVPTVMSMSAIGVLGIVLGVIGVGIGWWWLAYRRYTTPAGEALLEKWLDTSGAEDLSRYETALHQDLLTQPTGGPDIANQMQFIRRLRGFGSA